MHLVVSNTYTIYIGFFINFWQIDSQSNKIIKLYSYYEIYYIKILINLKLCLDNNCQV